MARTTVWSQRLKDAQAPVSALLRVAGFKKSGNSYNRGAEDGLAQVVNFQSGQYVSMFHGSFTVNVGIYIPCMARLEGSIPRGQVVSEAFCEIRDRLSAVAGLGGDEWWPLDESSGNTGAMLAALINDHGLAFLDRFSSYEKIIRRFSADGALPFCNSARSALVVGVIHHDRGELELARESFALARRHAPDHAHFRAHVSEIESACGLWVGT